MSKYIPLNYLVTNKGPEWTFTSLDLSYNEITKQGIVLWCVNNVEGQWTMLGGNKFGFEDAGDAVMFRMQFGFGSTTQYV